MRRPAVAFTNATRIPGDPPPVPDPFILYTPSGTHDPQVTYVRWTFSADIPADTLRNDIDTFLAQIRAA